MSLINSDDLKKLREIIQPLIDLGGAHRWDPKRCAISLTVEDLKELESLHFHLENLLYQLKLAEIEKAYAAGEIDINEYSKKVPKIDKEPLYRFI
jgi:hypothetical protein